MILERPTVMADDPTHILARVHHLVKQFLPPYLDHEDIAVEILIESWANGHPQPSYNFIHQRCIDALRSSSREHNTLRARFTPSDFRDPSPDDADEVNHLMMILNPFERKVIWYRFYLDHTIEEIAANTKFSITTIRETLANALFKMRQES